MGIGYVKLYRPEKNTRKGDNGRLLIIAGSKQYHGAAMLAVLAARRFVDLVYFHPAENDEFLINAIKCIPEVIVLKDLSAVDKIDCVLYGNGIGKAKVDLNKVKGKRLVIDADGLKQLRSRIPEKTIITPHESEFKMLFGKAGTENNVKEMAKKHNCVIVKKGPVDIISNGIRVLKNKKHNPGMTKGGTGDILAGLVAALYCNNTPLKSAVAASKLNRLAGDMAKAEFGFNFCAGDLLDRLPIAYKKARY